MHETLYFFLNICFVFVAKVATALIVSCKLINEDTIPAVLPLVTKLLNHNESTIRKKAIK